MLKPNGLEHRDFLHAALLFLLPVPLIIGCVYLVPRFELIADDGLSMLEPLHTDTFRQISRGELPLWSHHTRCGYPLLAREQGAMYPPHFAAWLIARLLNLPNKIRAVSYVLHIGVALAGAYLLLRRLGCHATTAAMGALGFGLAGPVFGTCANWSHYFFPVAWAPLLFYAIEELWAGRREWRWTLLAGACGGLILLLSGNTHASAKIALLGALYFALRANRRNLAFALTRGGVAALLALAMSAGQLAATGEFIMQSQRWQAEGVKMFDAFTNTCPVGFWNGLLLPLLNWEWPCGFKMSFHGGNVFTGPLTALGIMLALVAWRRPGAHRALLALFGFYLVLAFGNYINGAEILQCVPLFKHFRWPVKWTVEFCAVAALLGALGLEFFRRREFNRSQRGVVFLLLGLWLLFQFMQVKTNTPGTFMLLLAWLGGTGVMCWLLLKDSPKFWGVALGWTLLAMILNIPLAQQARWCEMRRLDHPPPLRPEGNSRVLYLATRQEMLILSYGGAYSYCLPHQYDLRSALGYAFDLRSQFWCEGLSTQRCEVENNSEPLVEATFFGSTWLKTLRVGLVVLPATSENLLSAARQNSALVPLDAVDPSGKLVFFKHTGFREPAFFVTQVQPQALLGDLEAQRGGEIRGEARKQAVRELLARDFATACVVQAGYAGPGAFAAGGIVSQFVENHAHIAFQTENANEGFVVVTDTWYPGWRAWIDGVPAPLYRANASFMGVRVPAGQHAIELRYRPAGLLALLAFSAIMTVSVLAATLTVFIAKVVKGNIKTI